MHPSALDAMRDELIPLATLETPNLNEVRLLDGIDLVDDNSGPVNGMARLPP